MKIFLVQHGKPVSKEVDAKKPLSAQGINDVKKMASRLKQSDIVINKIFHSGKMRAFQTSEIFISILNPDLNGIENKSLLPLADVKDTLEHVGVEEGNLMLVGHLPHLSKFLSLLVTEAEGIPVVAFQQGCVVCVSNDNNTDGKWSINWMLVPDIV